MQASITVKNCNVIKGSSWSALEGFVSGTNSDGKSVSITELKIHGDVLIQVPGDYPVVYSFYDKSLKGDVQAIITVTVLDRKSLSPQANMSLKEN